MIGYLNEYPITQVDSLEINGKTYSEEEIKSAINRCYNKYIKKDENYILATCTLKKKNVGKIDAILSNMKIYPIFEVLFVLDECFESMSTKKKKKGKR